jgi:23S rRNA (cytidine1920-2'-O)/16S rRNA (cytidine1409-2'-O)-methyltransferase
MARVRTVRVVDALAAAGVADPAAAIAQGIVEADGLPVTSTAARVRDSAVVRLRGDTVLRGEAKLRAALDRFTVPVAGRTALDIGAAAGGFTRVLLERGARRVYACDVGHGQLLGSLRQDPRVVNLEATNVGALDATLIPEPIEIVTADVSYLSLGEAVTQAGDVDLASGCDLVGLVKPMFELRLAAAPTDAAAVAAATERAAAAISAAGWTVRGSMPSPVTGAHGAWEGLLWARRD